MKKLMNVVLVICLAFMSTYFISAEEDYSDTEYWDSYCEDYRLSGTDSEKFQACAAYQRYKIESSADRIEDLTQQAEELKGNLEEAQRLMEQYNAEIVVVQEEIAAQQVEIDDLQIEIDYLQEKIDAQEEDVAVLNDRVLERMASAQSTMHFNAYLEFLLGATDFEDLLRRGYGLESIMRSDEELRTELQDVLDQLNDDRRALDESMDILETQMSTMQANEANLDYLIEFQRQVYEETYLEIEETLANLEEEYQNYADLVSASDLEGLPNDEGFISPIPGASISAGTWYYDSDFGNGSIHLGVDFAVGLGTEIYAPATGVVLISSDGCPTGYLGDSCGSAGGGEIYGGNQIYLMVSAGGSIYGVIFCHLLAGTLQVAEGDIVVQGQQIAQVGSSGNSTGPHSHVELFYLGEGNLVDIPSYLERNYTKSFNCGWGSAALSRLCENGVGAPCRLRPENYFAS